MKSLIRKNSRPAVVIICLLIFTGCVGAGWGGLKHNRDLMVSYKAKALPENLNYYYCGRSSIPYAVVGIDKAYAFEGKTWLKIESTDDLYYKIKNLSDLEPVHTIPHYKDIIGPDGRVMGLWFSYYNSTGVRVDEENKIIEVFNPYKPGSRYFGD
jgi:hypothetical protein